jgi:hypothetical protein
MWWTENPIPSLLGLMIKMEIYLWHTFLQNSYDGQKGKQTFRYNIH